MKPFILATAVIGCLTVGLAKAEAHLSPCEEILDEYGNRVEATAHSVVLGEIDYWAAIFPSFSPEWLVAFSRHGEEHLITYVVFDQSIWHSSWVPSGPGVMKHDLSASDATPLEQSIQISSDLYRALSTEWERSINESRPSDSFGLDGTTYKFRRPDGCASAWSPEPDSRNGRLIALVEEAAKLSSKRNRVASKRQETRLFSLLREIPNE